MVDLLIANVEDNTSDDEIKEFLIRYGFPPFDQAQRLPGTGAHPAVLVTFNDLDEATLRTLQPKVHNMHWKGHTITARIMREFGH